MLPNPATRRPTRTHPRGRARGDGGTLRHLTLGAAALLVLLLAGLATGRANADPPGQAALVVQFGDGRTLTRCLELQGDSTTGADLLTRSGLRVVLDSSTGLGVTVCKVEDVGCAYPSDACFCQCMGGEGCRYWNYFYRDPGQAQWIYSALGALLHDVKPGSVEAWVWGDGHTPPAEGLTFEAICASPTAVPSAAASRQVPSTASTGELPPTAPNPGPAQVAATVVPTPVSSPSELPLPTPTPSPSLYWPFGVLILILIGIAAYLRLGRK